VTTLACTVDHELENDLEVEAQLATVTGQQWSELWDVANQIAELEAPGVWDGGNVIDHTDDGHDVYEMPFIVYADPVVRYLRLWDEMGLVIPYGTVFLDRTDTPETLEWLDSASIADVVRFGSAVLRLERFGDGLILEAIETGSLAAVIRRLRAWKLSHPVSRKETRAAEFPAWFRLYRDRCRWRAAKSGPPHEYTVREWRPEGDEEFEKAVAGISEFGYPQVFYRNTYTYFNLDGLKYWTMGNPLAETTVLNRDPIESLYRL